LNFFQKSVDFISKYGDNNNKFVGNGCVGNSIVVKLAVKSGVLKWKN